MEKKERRHTSHLTADFKEFNRSKISEVFGFEIDEESAWSVFKMIHRLPLYFLAGLDDKEVDSQGEKSIALPRVGKFRFRMTKAQKEGFEHEFYPRYKFYPSRAIETEVENMHGVADEESIRSFNKLRSSEERKLGLAVKAIQSHLKLVYSIDEDSVSQETERVESIEDLMVSFGKSLESIVEKRVRDILETSHCKDKVVTQEDLDDIEDDTFDENDDEEFLVRGDLKTSVKKQEDSEFDGDFVFGGVSMDMGEEEEPEELEEESVIKVSQIDPNNLDDVEDFDFDFDV